jgi:uncharacterized protein YbaP (TraB family)
MPVVAFVVRSFLRSAVRLLVAAGFVACATSLYAKDAPKQSPAPATGQCRGVDMLAELETKSPDVYKAVLDEGAKLPNTEAVLWKVEKEGRATSYLFGTMHLSDQRIATLSPAVKDAIGKSSTVALEVADLSDNALAEAMSKAASLAVYTDGTTLSAKVTADEFKKVQELVTKSGMPAEFAGMFRPWLVSMLLAMSDCERKQIASGAPVLDMRVAEEAQKNGVKVEGLETVEDQLSALASIPDDQQIQMMKVALKYTDRADDMMETLVQMYMKRRIGAAMPFQVALAAQHDTPASAFDGFRQMLLVDRNIKMRNAAKPLLERGKVFIAVGALHLPGPTGLVELLRETGYTVTPIE